ncbi:MAG: hypothetical protein AB7U39_18940, partial [Ilumatobacteraceae bacterium]
MRVGLGIRLVAIAGVLPVALVFIDHGPSPVRAAAVAEASAFTPITPQRLVDTRIGLGAPQQRLQTATSIDVQVTGRLGVPSSATAVVANVTAVDASGPGYLQVLPTGRAALGSSSTLNVDLVGQTIPNATFAPLGDSGRLTVYAIFTTDVVIDIFGYFTPATSSSAGRLVPLTPQRILDTRIELGWKAPVSMPPVPSPSVPSTTVASPPVPSPGTRPGNPGDAVNCSDFATYPQAKAWYDLYYPYYGDVANLDADNDGLPCETLPGRTNALQGEAVAAATVVTLQVAGRGDVPSSGVSAVVMNVTAVDPLGPGFVQVAPTPVVAGASSNLNTAPGRTTANLVVVPLGATGTVDLYVTTPADLVADVVGYFTDASAPSTNVGLFVPIVPSRQLDSRPGAPGQPPAGPLPAGTVTTIDVNDIASSAIAVAGNLTATGAERTGYLQIAAPPIALGVSSNLNVAYPGQTVANAVVTPASQGLVQLFNQTPTHELLDVTGWFTSAVASDPPVPTTQPPVTQPPATQPPTTPVPTTPTTPPPPANPDGKIAFARSNQIYTINSDGSGELKLTSGDKNYWPRWSPDGEQIAYVHETPGAVHEIWLMDANGANKRKVATTGDRAFGAAWSPDGTRLAFQPAAGPAVILTLSTGSVQPLIGEETPGLEEEFIFTGTPVWSPDGGTLVFESGHAVFDEVIYDFDLDTLQVTVLLAFYHAACSASWTYGPPELSADGSLLAVPFQDHAT